MADRDWGTPLSALAAVRLPEDVEKIEVVGAGNKWAQNFFKNILERAGGTIDIYYDGEVTKLLSRRLAAAINKTYGRNIVVKNVQLPENILNAIMNADFGTSHTVTNPNTLHSVSRKTKTLPQIVPESIKNGAVYDLIKEIKAWEEKSGESDHPYGFANVVSTDLLEFYKFQLAENTEFSRLITFIRTALKTNAPVYLGSQERTPLLLDPRDLLRYGLDIVERALPFDPPVSRHGVPAALRTGRDVVLRCAQSIPNEAIENLLEGIPFPNGFELTSSKKMVGYAIGQHVVQIVVQDVENAIRINEYTWRNSGQNASQKLAVVGPQDPINTPAFKYLNEINESIDSLRENEAGTKDVPKCDRVDNLIVSLDINNLKIKVFHCGEKNDASAVKRKLFKGSDGKTYTIEDLAKIINTSDKPFEYTNAMVGYLNVSLNSNTKNYRIVEKRDGKLNFPSYVNFPYTFWQKEQTEGMTSDEIQKRKSAMLSFDLLEGAEVSYDKPEPGDKRQYIEFVIEESTTKTKLDNIVNSNRFKLDNGYPQSSPDATVTLKKPWINVPLLPMFTYNGVPNQVRPVYVVLNGASGPPSKKQTAQQIAKFLETTVTGIDSFVTVIRESNTKISPDDIKNAMSAQFQNLIWDQTTVSDVFNKLKISQSTDVEKGKHLMIDWEPTDFPSPSATASRASSGRVNPRR